VNKNRLIVFRVGCKTLFNLVELIERDLNLKKGVLKVLKIHLNKMKLNF
jgi:hypothetical protein